MKSLGRRAALGVLLVALAGCRTDGPPRTPYPTDAELVERLSTHRAAFDSLLTEEYRDSLPGELGLLDRVDRSYRDATDVRLPAWYQDLFGPGGCTKGYAWLTAEPRASELVDSLGTALGQCGPEEMDLYRHVEGNWYLYFTARN